ncbi:MAG: carboxypeptidase regulatory-like protein, partial [Chitinophagaceae bacterium]|nr:carboxypeptidase regulatory-like protein [Chitinophagaceae bacterium]
MNLKLFLLLPVFITLLYGCKKGTPGPANNGGTVTLPGVIVPTVGQVTIAGYVYKEDGSPADNTTITIGSSSIATGATGAFSYTGAVADSDKVVIRFIKSGYFDSWKTLVVENNAVYNGLKIYLRPEVVAGTYNAATGGVVNNTNTYSHALAKLTFQANSVIRDDGTAYSGIVTAIVLPATYFDTMIELPGDKRAVDAGNHIVALENYGGICVKLKGAAGENLKLSKPMSYSCSLNPMAGNPASGTLKLWTFNEDTGLWVENSAATFNISYDNGLITTTVSGSTTGLVFLQWAVPYTAALLRAYISPAAQGFALVN